MLNNIFIQIASFRDQELPHTINDLLLKSRYPEKLRIVVCNQYNKEDNINIDKFKKNKRIKFIEIEDKLSKGVCWARNKIQQCYNNEDYTLQIDSHTRFVKNWDYILIEMINNLIKSGVDKPMITSYAPHYTPDIEDKWDDTPLKIVFDKFLKHGTPFLKPIPIYNHVSKNKPIKAYFYSAHFCFTIGKFCREVKHDPSIYFQGEEISIGARSFTNGYDMFHPHRIILWHQYQNDKRVKHWDIDKEWKKKDIISHKRIRELFNSSKNNCEYGLGTVRSLSDYEKYIKLSLRSGSGGTRTHMPY